MMPIDNLEEFMDWLLSLNPNEPIDMHEALTIYYNQEIYGEEV